jgi:hypothetical protein
MNMSHDPIQTAKNMKQIDGEATPSDFMLSNTIWSDPTDDDLINLQLYKSELFWENMIHTLTTNERIPAKVWLEDRLCDELGVSEDTLYDYLDKGMLLMTEDSEYQEIEVSDEEVDEFIADNPEIISVLDDALFHTIVRNDEISELEKMFEAS